MSNRGIPEKNRLELVELLDSLASSGKHAENIESDGLAERSALSHGNLVTLHNTESWRDVRSKVLVSLLVSGVLWDEVEVFAADDQRAVHLGRNNGAGQDTATNGDKSSKWALLVNVVSLNRSLWCPESQSNVLVPSSSTLSNPAGLRL